MYKMNYRAKIEIIFTRGHRHLYTKIYKALVIHPGKRFVGTLASDSLASTEISVGKGEGPMVFTLAISN